MNLAKNWRRDAKMRLKPKSLALSSNRLQTPTLQVRDSLQGVPSESNDAGTDFEGQPSFFESRFKGVGLAWVAWAERNLRGLQKLGDPRFGFGFDLIGLRKWFPNTRRVRFGLRLVVTATC